MIGRRDLLDAASCNCSAVIMALLLGELNARQCSVLTKRYDESTMDFVQKNIGVHQGMVMTEDLDEGTYLMVKCFSEKVLDAGFCIQHGRECYAVPSDCVLSWHTGVGYVCCHLYRLGGDEMNYQNMVYSFERRKF